MIEGPTARARSEISGEEMEITAHDLFAYLGIHNGGEALWPVFRRESTYDWTAVNTVLQGCPGPNYHCQDTHVLCRDAYLIQHILRTSVFPKGGDRRNITTTLSMATYYIMTGVRFDIAGAIMQLICNIPVTRRQRRLKNIPYGHVIQHVCSLKYNMVLPYGITNDVIVEYFKKRDIFTMLKRFNADGMLKDVVIPLGDRFARASDASSEEEAAEGEADMADAGLGEGEPQAEGQPAGHAERAHRDRPTVTEQLDYLRRYTGRSERYHNAHRMALATLREEQLAQRRILDSMAAGREADSRSIDEILRLLQAQAIGPPHPSFGVGHDAGGTDAGGSGAGGPSPSDFGDIGISPSEFL